MAASNLKCPICGQMHTPFEQYCPHCLWEYRIYPDNVSAVVLKMEKEREQKYREIYGRVANNDGLIADYKKRIEELEATLSKKEQTIKDLEKKPMKKEEQIKSRSTVENEVGEKKSKEKQTFIVGREGSQHKEILEKTVSRQHCRVTLLADGRVEIENLSKSNGTLINGERIDKVITSMDAELKMGNYTVKVRDLFPPRKV